MTADDPHEDIRSNPLFQKLLADAHNLEQDVERFNERYGEMVRADTSGVGSVLRSHLIVEHFLDEYLRKANPGVQGWDAARLTFPQKAELAYHPRTSMVLLLPGIRALNAARNRLAHTLGAPLDSINTKPMEEFIGAWYGALGKAIPTGIDVVSHFALVTAAFLDGTSQMIDRYASDGGIVKLLEWYGRPQ